MLSRRIVRGFAALGLALTLGFFMSHSVAAAAPGATAKPAAKAVQPTPTPPSPIAVLALVRSTLLAVDQANRTGNYTVLRDLAGPRFRDANNATKLSQIFGVLIVQGIDLLPVSVVEPRYTQDAKITRERMLHVAGVFSVRPRPVAFEILFEPVDGQWRLYGLSISPAVE